MKQLKTIYPHEIDPKSPRYRYSSFTLRQAARAIIFDGPKVALIHVRNDGYYMLPGGGVEDGEGIPAALAREVYEELGCDVVVGVEVGKIITYLDRWKNKQVDYCFTARFVPLNVPRELTDFEAEAGYDIVWAADLDEAIELVRRAKPIARDGFMIQERDATFLESVKAMQATAENT